MWEGLFSVRSTERNGEKGPGALEKRILDTVMLYSSTQEARKMK